MEERPSAELLKNVAIREMRPEDLAPMALVMQRASAKRKGDAMPEIVDSEEVEYLQRRMARQGAWCQVGIDDGGVVGFIMGNSLPDKPGVEDLGLIMVAPEKWGQNMGGMLMEGVESYHRLRGVSAIELWTQIDNIRAQGLYTKRGYERTGETRIKGTEEMVRYRLELL